MQFYPRTNQDKLDTAYNRCFFDAKEGRVWLALQRLEDLAIEFPDDAHVIYCEALIRKDYLGQGLKAQSLFKKASRLDNKLKEAACNAVMFAASEDEFKDCAVYASKVAPSDKGLQILIEEQHRFAEKGLPYWQFLESKVPPEESQLNGTIAALIEVEIYAGGVEMSPAHLDNLHLVRAERLRALDRDAENRLIAIGEQFLPEDRMALREALHELDKSIVEGSPGYYDPKQWNLRSAWAYQIREYEKAINFADRAIQLRPSNYPLPYINKSMALWYQGKNQEAMVSINEALQQAEISKNASHIEQAKQTINNYASFKREYTLEELYPYIKQILYGAGDAAEKEITAQRSTLERMGKLVVMRTRMIGKKWKMAYVVILAELLSFYSPEATYFIIIKASERSSNLVENILYAALYLTAHAEGVMKHDVARFLALNIISPIDAIEIRKVYRLGILEVSAAAKNELAHLDIILRKQLLRLHPEFPSLIADQEPIDDVGRERANRTILSKFTENPVISFRSNQKKGCIRSVITFIAIVSLLVYLFLVK